jgi:AcrR family transcriptional regulator
MWMRASWLATLCGKNVGTDGTGLRGRAAQEEPDSDAPVQSLRTNRRRPLDTDGRQRLIAAALKLFAERGIDGVSMRAINREAGLGSASAHYHFGTKAALVQEIVRLNGASITNSLKGRAKKLSSTDDTVTARDLVEMLAEPYLALLEAGDATGHRWIKMLSQLEHSEDVVGVTNAFSSKATLSAVRQAYPNAQSASAARGLRMCFDLLILQLARIGEPGRRPAKALEIHLLLDFLSGGLDQAMKSKSASDRPFRTGELARIQPAQ